MSKITAIRCPSCGGSLTLKRTGHKMMLCPYCASPLEYDDSDVYIKEYIIKENHSVDYARIAKLEYKDREDVRDGKKAKTVFSVLLLAAVFALIVIYLPGIVRDIKD